MLKICTLVAMTMLALVPLGESGTLGGGGVAAVETGTHGGNGVVVASALDENLTADGLACTSDGGTCSQNSDCCSGDCDYSNGTKYCWPK